MRKFWEFFKNSIMEKAVELFILWVVLMFSACLICVVTRGIPYWRVFMGFVVIGIAYMLAVIFFCEEEDDGDD